MSHFNQGLISAYNSLTDKHLAGYFSNTRIRRHLQRAGLITRSGRIVPDKEYRHKLIQRAHQRHVRECLAQAIFHKVLEMERLHQIEIKKKLEEFARRERVHKIKVERPKRREEDIIRILSPRPPVGARSIQKQNSGPEGEHSESSESPNSSRPNTAPGKMQRPVRLKPIHSNSTTASVRRSSPYRHHETSQDSDQPFNRTMNKESRRRLTTKEASHGISPYLLPVINNFVTPIPPATKRKERGAKITPNSTYRGRRLLPTTASSSADVTEDPPWLRSSVHQSRVCINMVYFGKTVHLFHDMNYMRDEVKVFQQHCGGENLCVFKGKLREGESFQFISRRHRGFPFSLTFFLNGLQVERLSSCCEFKHRKGSRLGGRLGHFGFSSVEGASPCYKCIIAMGLDKKPTPPPKRGKEDRGQEESAPSSKHSPEMETERTVGDVVSPSECETRQALDTETQVKEKAAPEEEKVRDDYEEDFEADDEGPTEEVEAKQEKSPSPSSETERQVPEKDSETEDDEKEDIKSHSGSSLSASDQESDAEATKDYKEDDNQPLEDNVEKAAASTDEKEKPNPGETATTDNQSALATETDMHNSAGDSTELEISDTSVPLVANNKQSNNTSEDQNDEKPQEESKNEEEQERAKSVQEKLAEAILKESQCSSEPELSDTSTEEEEEPTDKGSKQNNKDQNTSSEQQQTLAEEKKCEEIVAVEVAQKQEELSEAENQKDAEQEPGDSSGSTKDEKVSEAEEDEKADETTAEEHKSEEPGESQLPINVENLSQDDKTADPLEEAKSADAEAAEKDEDSDEKTAVETEILPDETGQGAKSREEDSSASEQTKKTDETAVPDNAEVEAMTASKTMEIKAEPSEEREALSCEEAPETDTERRQEADSEDAAAASQTEVTPENSSSLPEECEDTVAEKTSEENIKDENSIDDIKEEEETGQTSGVEVSKDDSHQERCEPEEERIDEAVEADEKIEKQGSEKDAQEEEKQAPINSDEIAEEENPQERETNRIEQEGNDKNEVDESADEKQNVAEGTENEPNTEEEGKETEEAERALNEENKSVNEENVEEPEKIEEDEYKEKSETKMAEEEKDEGAEKSVKGEYEDKDAEAENDDECQEGNKDVTEKTTGENEETSEVTEKHEEADVDNMRSPENIVESEDVGGSEPTEETINGRKAETIRRSSEKGEIDAENGEISESKPFKDEEEAATKETTDLKTAEQAEEETKTEEPSKGENTEVKEVTVESGNTEDDRVETVERDTTEGNDSVTKYDESAKNSPEPEMSGLESKEEKSDVSKKIEQDENKSEQKNRESDSIENNNNIESDSVVTPSEDQEESSALTTFDAGCSSSPLYQEKCESKTETPAHTDESAAGADLSAADGENGVDTEEASKASEEGASVVLKPQAQNKDDEPQRVAAGEETPEALAKEDNTDMVTNWINMHQTSKFFETFVEPLEDLEEEVSNAQISNSNNKETESTELLRSQSPGKMVFEDEEEMHKLKDEKESRDKAQTEAVESDLNSMLAADDRDGNDPQAGGLEEKTEVKGFIPNEETNHGDGESGKEVEKPQENKENCESFGEDKAQDEHGTDEKNAFSKTEVESFSGSLKPESILENATNISINMDVNQTAHDLSFEAVERNESKSPDGMKDEAETQDEADKKSQKVTQTNDFTAPKSDDGSQEESHAEKIQPKPSQETLSGERRDVQLIQDIKHALGKDRLSTFSVDEKLFGHSSYPLLTAARTESGH